MSLASPIGLVVNPAARGVKRHHLGPEPFWRAQIPSRLVYLTRSLEELDEAVAALRAAGVQVVAGLGGDGSLHHLVDAVLRCYHETETPIVLPLAGGTMNGLPRALGTGGSPARVLTAAVAAMANGPPPAQVRHVIKVFDEQTNGSRFGFSFAAGLVTRAFREYYRRPEPGLLDALRASILPLRAALLGGTFYDDLRLDVRAGGAPWMPEPPHTILASVMDNPVLWFKPFGPPLGDADAFHLAATSMRPREIAPRLWSLFRGRCRHPRLRVDQCRTATVRGDCGYVIDGDLYGNDGGVDVQITVGPRLRFLVTAARPGMPR